MKTLKFLVLLFGLSFFSCGDDSPNSAAECSTAFAQEFQTEVTDISNAVSAYGQDQSASNCQGLKDAYNAYIDALEDWENCASINNSLTEFNAALDNARQSINALVC